MAAKASWHWNYVTVTLCILWHFTRWRPEPRHDYMRTLGPSGHCGGMERSGDLTPFISPKWIGARRNLCLRRISTVPTTLPRFTFLALTVGGAIFLEISRTKRWSFMRQNTEDIDSVLPQHAEQRCESVIGGVKFRSVEWGPGARPRTFTKFFQWTNVKIPEWHFRNGRR